MSHEIRLIENNSEKRLIKKILLEKDMPIPCVGSELEIFIEERDYFEKTIVEIKRICYKYKESDNSDGYGNWSSSSMKIEILVDVISYETNKPPKPEPVKKRTRSRKNT